MYWQKLVFSKFIFLQLCPDITLCLLKSSNTCMSCIHKKLNMEFSFTWLGHCRFDCCLIYRWTSTNPMMACHVLTIFLFKEFIWNYVFGFVIKALVYILLKKKKGGFSLHKCWKSSTTLMWSSWQTCIIQVER